MTSALGLKKQAYALEAENNIAIRGADIIVVAVKPQIAGQVLKSLDTVSKSQLVISIAAALASIACNLGSPMANLLFDACRIHPL